MAVTPKFESRLRALKGGGNPLPESVRTSLESRFGYDFSQVRVHADSNAVESAQAIGAQAFTMGHDILFGVGHFTPDTSAGQRLLAHELTHVIQQDKGENRIQRDIETSTSNPEVNLVTPSEEDYRSFVEEVIRLFEEASSATEPREQTGSTLSHWETVYDNARTIILEELSGDEALERRLRDSYRAAMPRVNIALVGAAPTPSFASVYLYGFEEDFLDNAKKYAETYLVDKDEVIGDIRSLAQLFDSVESSHPEHMIGKIDIFAHGGVRKVKDLETGLAKKLAHVIWFGDEVYDVDAVRDEANNRKYESSYIRSISRFDEKSEIELHVCHLGATLTEGDLARGERLERKAKLESGEEFLTRFGESLGGTHGQLLMGYKQFYFVRRFDLEWNYTDLDNIPHWKDVRNTENDIYHEKESFPRRFLSGDEAEDEHKDFISRFERRAVNLFDTVVATSQEVRQYLSDAERAGGAITRERKIQIMREIYDQNGTWVFSFMHPEAKPVCDDPVVCVGSSAFTFTGEKEAWSLQVTRVRIQPSVTSPKP